jgi:hypothetical protein
VRAIPGTDRALLLTGNPKPYRHRIASSPTSPLHPQCNRCRSLGRPDPVCGRACFNSSRSWWR